MKSQRFINTKTGEIVTQVPLLKIAQYKQYDGPLEDGERCSLHEHACFLELSIDHHETDLYLKDTPEARALLEEHDKRGRNVYRVDGWNVNRFYDGDEWWLDVPFAYETKFI